jgi:hypothetical protein
MNLRSINFRTTYCLLLSVPPNLVSFLPLRISIKDTEDIIYGISFRRFFRLLILLFLCSA